MAQLISAWPSDPRSSVQSLVTPVKLSYDRRVNLALNTRKMEH